MSNEIPYIISSAHPDYKRPHIYNEIGTIENDKIDEFLLEKLVDFVYERINLDNLKNVKDIKDFWENFYSDCYMDNSPWTACVFIDGKWNWKSPSDKELLKALIRERDKNKN